MNRAAPERDPGGPAPNDDWTLAFDSPGVGRLLDAAPPSLVDRLAFGVIRIAVDGRVIGFNRTEAEQSGFAATRVIGLDFFAEVAPCMSTAYFRGRIEAMASRGALDLVLGHTGDPVDPTRLLLCRVVSAAEGGYWMLTQR